MELPQISSGAYMMSSYGGDIRNPPAWIGGNVPDALEHFRQQMEAKPQPKQSTETEKSIMSQKRIVQVFIADPDVKVPVEDSLLAKTEPKMTDLTDQELFYEIDVKTALDEHNKKRVQIVDKQATQRVGKDVMLEPIKIRDLKMTVVVVATF